MGSLWSSTGKAARDRYLHILSRRQGWEELDFSTPVAVTAGTAYVASYFTATGHYAVTQGGLSSGFMNGGLTAPANGGVYAYGFQVLSLSSSYKGSESTGLTSSTTRDASRPGNVRAPFGLVPLSRPSLRRMAGNMVNLGGAIALRVRAVGSLVCVSTRVRTTRALTLGSLWSFCRPIAGQRDVHG